MKKMTVLKIGFNVGQSPCILSGLERYNRGQLYTQRQHNVVKLFGTADRHHKIVACVVQVVIKVISVLRWRRSCQLSKPVDLAMPVKKTNRSLPTRTVPCRPEGGSMGLYHASLKPEGSRCLQAARTCFQHHKRQLR